MTAVESVDDRERRRGPSVAILRWPEQELERWRLAASGEPRVLLLAEGESPPIPVDDRERCVQEGSGADALIHAIDSLRDSRRPVAEAPHLDEDGLLWYDNRWVAVTDVQIPIVRLILANQGRVTPNSELLVAYRQAGGSDRPSSLRSVLYRVGRRFAAVGLDLLPVRSRGVMLSREQG